ncbi:hypothetical protein FQZ97_414130 [compost metagenome]
MAAVWKKKSKPGLVIERIKKHASLNEKGALTFVGFGFFEVEATLHSIIDYGEKISFQTKKSIRDRALRECLRAGALTAELFIKQINKQISLHKEVGEADYALTTSVSVAGGLPLSRIVLPEATIVSYPAGLPKKYSGRGAFDEQWEELYGANSPLPISYSAVVVKVRARSSSDAFDLAMSSLDFVRGIIGLNVNPPYQYSFLGGSSKPLNKVMLGGMHCLHHGNGRMAESNQFWYERHYSERSPVDVGPKRKSVAKGCKFLINGLLKYPKDDVELIMSAVARYANAYDEYDRDVLIQKLWAALESIAGGNADAIVRRCSYLFWSREYELQVLEYIRDYRNQNVHRGHSEDELDNHCFQLQKFFRKLIIFYAGHSDFFQSLGEANRFLDFSDDKGKLEREIQLLEKAKSYRFSDER